MTELNYESRDYTNHEFVKRADSLCDRIRPALDKLKASKLTDDVRYELSFNMENHAKQLRRLKKMLKPDPTFVVRVDFPEVEDWLDITMSDAVLLKINELNDILERKLNRIEKALKPKPPTKEQRLAQLKAMRADPFHYMNSGY